MQKPIRVKINVKLIDKAALYVGDKGTYLDLTMWPSEDSKYGDDYRVVQDLGKDRRGEKSPILGNGKFFETRQSAAPEAPAPTADDGDCIPF